MRTAFLLRLVLLTACLVAPFSAEASSYAWRGAYFGLFGGGDWHPSQPADATLGIPEGLTAGGVLGINVTNSWLIFGSEADISVPGLSDWSDCSGGNRTCPDSADQDFQASLRLKGGIALDRVLIYGTGGYALSSINDSRSLYASDQIFHSGWTYGGGVELGVTENARIAVEYRDVTYRDRSVGAPVHGDEITLRLNFRP